MEAVQNLLIFFCLIIKLFKVCRSIVCILRQHQLDITAERQILGKKQQHFREHVGAEAAVSICVERAGRRNGVP